MLYEVEQSFFENCVNILTQNDRLPDLVFAPTLAFTRFSEDLLLRYAMITARSPARRLTWILLPAPGLDFQPQTRAYLLSVSFFGHPFFFLRTGIYTACFFELHIVLHRVIHNSEISQNRRKISVLQKNTWFYQV